MRIHKVLLCLVLYAAGSHAVHAVVGATNDVAGTSIRQPHRVGSDLAVGGGVAYDGSRVVSRPKRSNLFFRFLTLRAKLPERIRNPSKFHLLHRAKRWLQNCVENVDVGPTKEAIVKMTATMPDPFKFDRVVQEEERFRESLLLGTDSDPIPAGTVKSILAVAGRIPTEYTDDPKHKANIAEYLRHGAWHVDNNGLQGTLLESLGQYAQKVRHVLLSFTWYKRHEALYEIGIMNDRCDEARKRDDPSLKTFCDRMPLDELEIIREQLLEIRADVLRLNVLRTCVLLLLLSLCIIITFLLANVNTTGTRFLAILKLLM